MNTDKSFAELIRRRTFSERLEYLYLGGAIGIETFGSSRYLNQMLYSSKEWKDLRNYVIARDMGCDLALGGYEIMKGIYVHHINPITKEMVLGNDPLIFDPNNLITVSGQTHRRIHYGIKGETYDRFEMAERYRDDTSPWKRSNK